MQAGSQRATWPVRSALVLVVGVALAALLALMWVKASAASAQELFPSEAWFSIATTSGTVSLSSDDPSTGAPGASTMHADFFNGWKKEALAALVSDCINANPFSAANPKPAKCKATG
jgi:hypothetical protein